MIKTLVYHKENLLGEVELYKINLNNGVLDDLMMNRREKGIRISHFSQPSERCPPLAVLHTISSNGVCFKMMESTPPPYSVEGGNTTPLMGLHLACLRDNKTAVMSLGDEELHLVAMQLRQMGRATPCFWGFSVATGLYQSCLGMLNLRCLGIVFDLDETLIVANTMRSFEDRIESLQRKIDVEMDPQRVAGMMAEVKRYQEDKAILKQYIENDQVVDSGEVFRIQSEVVPAMSDNRQPIVRPIIRLPDKNIILTRINPQIRDTSVLVRLRPAWEDLRNYLTARGRKRFEVYVCTMAERDYALEMWRLLDPNSNLIHTRELLDRIVCVKSGSKKSLFNVFHDGICHPKMALVIDDRLKVWDEEDQPRIHVVPPFAPYYAPQAEANNAIPVLCVARNVACNVRGGFFKEFDESLLQRISGVLYEDDLSDIPSPDVSNYLVSEDEESGLNGNREPLGFDGMADAEVERRLKEAISASSAIPPAVASTGNSLDPRLSSTLTFAIPAPPVTVPQPAPQGFFPPFSTIQFPQAAPSVRPPDHVSLHDPGLRGSPATEEGEVPESELDPDTRRRLLILQHGQDIRDHAPPEPQLPVRPPSQAPIPAPGPVPVSAPQVQSHGGWFLAEDRVSPDPLNRALTKEYPSIPDVVHAEKQRPHCPPFPQKMDSSIRSERFFEKQRFPREVRHRDERTRSNHSPSSHQSNPGDRVAKGQSSSGNRDLDIESKQGPRSLLSPAGALREIALKCGTEVDFKPALVATTELKFYMEVYFAGEKIGEGNGTTRRDAQHQAAETSLKNLSGKYLEHIKSDLNFPRGEASAAENTSDTGLANDVNSYDERSLSEPTRSQESSLEDSKKSASSVSALKELCMMEGLGFDFRADLSTSSNGIQKDEVHAEVEIDGQVWGKGTGLTWDEAKMQAAETALESRKSMLGQLTRKQPESPRSLEAPSSKRMKPEYPEILQ